jgi:hypothetical protein
VRTLKSLDREAIALAQINSKSPSLEIIGGIA